MRTISSYKKFFISASAVCALGSGLLLASAQQAHAQLFISQIYGGGGNTGAQYNRDFVELYNGGAAPVSLTGYTLQYQTALGTNPFGSSITLNGSIGANSYYLIGINTAGANGTALPTTNATSNAFNISATDGKVALANSATAVTDPNSANVVDFVGYGTANEFEGSAAAPAGSNTTSIARKSAPTNYTTLSDTNDNAADFFTTAPTPRNSSQTSLQPLDTPEPGTFALGLTALPILGGIGLRRRALSRKARAAAHA